MAELLVRLDDGEFFEHGEFVCVLAPSPVEASLQDADVVSLMDALCDELLARTGGAHRCEIHSPTAE